MVLISVQVAVTLPVRVVLHSYWYCTLQAMIQLGSAHDVAFARPICAGVQPGLSQQKHVQEP